MTSWGFLSLEINLPYLINRESFPVLKLLLYCLPFTFLFGGFSWLAIFISYVSDKLCNCIDTFTFMRVYSVHTSISREKLVNLMILSAKSSRMDRALLRHERMSWWRNVSAVRPIYKFSQVYNECIKHQNISSS